MKAQILGALLGAGMIGQAAAAAAPQTPLDDPYDTGMWDYLQVTLLNDPAQIAFDDRVVVVAPESAEDSFQVPVTVDASALGDVEEIVVAVDYGPIPHILTYRPTAAKPVISFRFKIDQSTPVRAAARTRDGVWHVGGAHIDAMGGGCSAPAAAYAQADWYDRLGDVRAKTYPQSGRVRVIVDHPMDTGLADGIPKFIIETLNLDAPGGERLAQIDLHEPVSENPVLTLSVDPALLTGELRLHGRDNNGNEIDATIPGEPAL